MVKVWASSHRGIVLLINRSHSNLIYCSHQELGRVD